MTIPQDLEVKLKIEDASSFKISLGEFRIALNDHAGGWTVAVAKEGRPGSTRYLQDDGTWGQWCRGLARFETPEDARQAAFDHLAEYAWGGTLD